jgi:hypothetical protein
LFPESRVECTLLQILVQSRLMFREFSSIRQMILRILPSHEQFHYLAIFLPMDAGMALCAERDEILLRIVTGSTAKRSVVGFPRFDIVPHGVGIGALYSSFVLSTRRRPQRPLFRRRG